MSSGAFESLQDERNALLKYALEHPPAGVTVRLPPHVKSLDECDLTACPSPLKLYAQAPAASGLRGKLLGKEKKPSRALEYNVGDYLGPTYAGAGGGDVVRTASGVADVPSESATPASSTARSRRLAEGGSGVKANRSSGAVNDSRAKSLPSGPPSTSAAPSQPSSSAKANRAGDGTGSAEDHPTPAGSHSKRPTAARGDAATLHSREEAAPSALSTFMSLFSGAASSTASVGTNDNGSAAAGRAEAEKPSAPLAASPQAEHSTTGHFFSGFFSKSKAHHSAAAKAGTPRARASVAGDAESTDAAAGGAAHGAAAERDAPAEEVRPVLPLNGTSSGVLADHVLKSLEPFLDMDRAGDGGGAEAGTASATSTAAAGANNGSLAMKGSAVSLGDAAGSFGGGAALPHGSPSRLLLPSAVVRPMSVKDPVVIEVCAIFDQTMLTIVSEKAMLTVYEHLLIATNFLLDVNREKYEREIFHVYREVLGVSEDQHTRCVANLIPAHLREGNVDREELRLFIEGLRPDARSLRSLIASSSDEEFVERMGCLLDTALRYSDEDTSGDDMGERAVYPLAVRASMYAVALTPMYRLDPQTEKPLYQPSEIANSVTKLRRRLLIPNQIEEYCHLHARLLANDEEVTMTTQCAFLKYVAKAVNQLGVRSLEKESLTPSVKYSYYVLQETLGMAMAPMPWLESLCKTSDSKRSVSAVFMETCAVLPTCFLSAFVRVNGTLVLPPTCPNGAFLYAFLATFLASSTLRKFTDGGEGVLHLVRARCDGDRARMPAAMFSAIAEMDKAAREYCQLLQRSLPLSPCLALTARFAIGNHILNQQWLRDAHGENGGAAADAAKSDTERLAADVAPVPETLVDDVCAVMRYLSATLPPHMPAVTGDEEMCLVLAGACMRHLYAIGAMVRRNDEAHFASLAAVLDKPHAWGTAHTVLPNAEALPKDVGRLVQRYGCPVLAPPLGMLPAELTARRLHDYVRSITQLAEAVSPGLPFASSDAATGSPPSEDMRRSSSVVHLRSDSKGFGIDGASATSAAPSASVPRAYAEFQRLRQLRAAEKPVVELLQRLNAVHRLQQASVQFFTTCAEQHRQVAAVTGAPLVSCERLWEQVGRALAEATMRLCEWVAVAVLCVHVGRDGQYDTASNPTSAVNDPHSDLEDEATSSSTSARGGKEKKAKKKTKRGAAGNGVSGGVTSKSDASVFGVMMNKFLKTDGSACRQHKRKGISLFGGRGGAAKDRPGGDAPILRAYPAVTINRVMLQLDDMLERCVAGHVPLRQHQQEIRSCAAAYLVALMHTVYLEDVVENVHFSPADADGLLADLDAVAQHYFAQDGSLCSPATSVTSDGGHTSNRPAPREGKGPRLLAELRGVVRYVMWQTSAALVNGGDGVPRFANLPEFEENTPWCKYIVKRVLARRMDKTAKQALSVKWFE